MSANSKQRQADHMKRPSGFTLFEIMFVVAIIGILAAIAYPSYTQYTLRGYRAQAKTALLETAQWMERNYSLTQSYAIQPNGTAIDNGVLASQPFTKVLDGTGTARYDVSFLAGPTANTFTLQAVPASVQISDLRCKTLTLTNAQARGVTGGATGTAGECWGK
jgi:type IV pilus assembly protein PilE